MHRIAVGGRAVCRANPTFPDCADRARAFSRPSHERRVAAVVLNARQRRVRQEVRAVQLQRFLRHCVRALCSDSPSPSWNTCSSTYIIARPAHACASCGRRSTRLSKQAERLGKQRRVGCAAERAVACLAVLQLERVGGAARQRELRIEDRAEQCCRGCRVARHFGLQRGLVLDARRLVVRRVLQICLPDAASMIRTVMRAPPA